MAPDWRSVKAMPRPTPRLAPVTRATCPRKEKRSMQGKRRRRKGEMSNPASSRSGGSTAAAAVQGLQRAVGFEPLSDQIAIQPLEFTIVGNRLAAAEPFRE